MLPPTRAGTNSMNLSNKKMTVQYEVPYRPCMNYDLCSWTRSIFTPNTCSRSPVLIIILAMFLESKLQSWEVTTRKTCSPWRVFSLSWTSQTSRGASGTHYGSGRGWWFEVFWTVHLEINVYIIYIELIVEIIFVVRKCTTNHDFWINPPFLLCEPNLMILACWNSIDLILFTRWMCAIFKN